MFYSLDNSFDKYSYRAYRKFSVHCGWRARCVRITSCSHRFFMRKCCWPGKSGVASVSQLTKAEKADHKAPVGRGPAARATGSCGAGQGGERSMAYDLLIKNRRVVNGTAELGFTALVAALAANYA